MDSILKLRRGFAVTVVLSVGNTSPFIVGALCKGFKRSRCRWAWVQAHGRGCCGRWSGRLSILTIGFQCRTLSCTLHTRNTYNRIPFIIHRSIKQKKRDWSRQEILEWAWASGAHWEPGMPYLVTRSHLSTSRVMCMSCHRDPTPSICQDTFYAVYVCAHRHSHTGTHTHTFPRSPALSPRSHASEHTHKHPHLHPHPHPHLHTQGWISQSTWEPVPRLGPHAPRLGPLSQPFACAMSPQKSARCGTLQLAFGGLLLQCRVKTWVTLSTFYTILHAKWLTNSYEK